MFDARSNGMNTSLEKWGTKLFSFISPLSHRPYFSLSVAAQQLQKIIIVQYKKDKQLIIHIWSAKGINPENHWCLSTKDVGFRLQSSVAASALIDCTKG